ncbi:MAG: 2-amino-4-hydroxy-6-hydroxymethyldihydropteridine diphosphokinase [Pseudomonadota bacterium]
MNRVWLSLGSNVDRERHIRAALAALRARFGELVVSPVYDCAAVGFAGDPFLNLVVGIDTTLPVGELAAYLRALEEANGRVREAGRRYNDRTLDVDILTFGNLSGTVDGVTLPRGEILKHAFVLRPLADVAPEEKHPVLGIRYRELLAQKDFSGQPMTRIDIPPF